MKEPDERLDRLAHEVIAAAIEVHRTLGPGFLESIYEEALCVELDLRKLSYRRQVPLKILYKSHKIGEARLDLLIEESLIVEVKAVETFVPIHTAQTISYLKAFKLHLALLFNFNVPILKAGIKRVILS